MLSFPPVFYCLLLLGAVDGEQWSTDDYVHFVTEPLIRSYRTRVIEKPKDVSLLQPGYFFYSPFAREGWEQVGPHIIDHDGELVWYGNSSANEMVQNFHACNWLNDERNHLCWSYHQYTDFGHIEAVHHVLDNTYSMITEEGYGRAPNADLRFPNPHEFHVLPGGQSFLQTIYQLVEVDLTAYGGPQKGYTEDGCIQEVDVTTGNATFSWCGLAHGLPLWYSYIFLPGNVVNDTGESYGTGELDKPWDTFHINSVDKNPEGDYFVSVRHMNTVLKIAGNDNVHGVPPGTILWKLGGRANDFRNVHMPDISRQHHVRYISSTKTETTFSLFNNQFQAHERLLSNGQIITLNNETMAVISAQKYHNPEGLVSRAMGSTQTLPNGNVLVGWGTIPQFTEFSRDGTLLYHAHIDRYDDTKGMENIQTYRVFKFEWVGQPSWDPKLLVYSRTCTTSEDSPLTAYISWNGATEVRHWRFYTSVVSNHGPWLRAGVFRKDGFETKVRLHGVIGGLARFAPYVKVEAMDEHGVVLATVFTDTFVPQSKFKNRCGTDSCQEGFEYSLDRSCADECRTFSRTETVVGLVLLILISGVAVYILWTMASKFWHSERARSI